MSRILKLKNKRKIEELEISLKEAQRKLLESSNELQAHEGLLKFAMEDMRKMYEELLKTQSQLMQSDKLATIGLLSAGIAHEINNPLTTLQIIFPMIQNHADRLQKELKNKNLQKPGAASLFKEIEEFIEQGLLCITAMSKIVKDIKMFSRSDKGMMNHENINSIIDSVISIAWNALKDKVTLKKEYGQVPLIHCNPQQLSQVFLNLIVNASQAMENKGTITIRTYTQDTFVKTQIVDTGCGIPKEMMQKIFEPFFTTKGAEKGTGLGLSISFDIIKRHQGKIDVESEVGKGTCFTISLPI